MNTKEQKVNLLLVDDEVEFLATVTRALERRDVKVVCATSGIDALQLVNIRNFDVAVIDVKMPGMDGIELFRSLRAVVPDLPVIILTGHGSIPQAFETSRDGVFDYLSKPCDVDLLVARIRAAAAGRSKKPASGEPEPEYPGAVRVLLVDDEVELLASMTTILSRRGLNVHTVSSGEEALGFLENKIIDVVVLDIKMPGMDGIQTLRRIKADIQDTEVILLTGHPEAENAFEGLKLGAVDYIVKPPDVGILVDKIKGAFRTRREKLERKHQDMLRNILEKYPD